MSRKQAQNRIHKRYVKQIPGYIVQYASDEHGNPAYRPDTPMGVDGQPIDDDSYRIQRQVPNRALKRRILAEKRKSK